MRSANATALFTATFSAPRHSSTVANADSAPAFIPDVGIALLGSRSIDHQGRNKTIAAKAMGVDAEPLSLRIRLSNPCVYTGRMGKPSPARHSRTNWSSCIVSLRKRGSLLIWGDTEMTWRAPRDGRLWKEDCPAARARNDTLRVARHYGRAFRKR